MSSRGPSRSSVKRVDSSSNSVMEVFYSIIKPAEGELQHDDSSDEEVNKNFEKMMSNSGLQAGMGTQGAPKPLVLSERASHIQNKIKSVAKILTMQRMLRERSEAVITKPGLGGGIGGDILLEGPHGKLKADNSPTKVLRS